MDNCHAVISSLSVFQSLTSFVTYLFIPGSFSDFFSPYPWHLKFAMLCPHLNFLLFILSRIFILPEHILKSQHSCFLSSLEKFHVLSLHIPSVPKFQHSLFLEILLDIYLSILIAYKGAYSQSYGFSSSHVWMWVLDYKEGWVTKNWCF